LFDRDLDLANEFSHCCNQWGHTVAPETNKVPSPHPIGTPLLWLPELALTHAAVLLRGRSNPGQEQQGYSTRYFVGAAFGSVVNGTLGLLLIYLFLRRRMAWPSALIATLAMLIATPLFFFMVFHPSYSHAQDLLAVSIFVWFWDRGRGRMTPGRWALLGLLAGLVALVREQYVLVALIAVADVVAYLVRPPLSPGGAAPALSRRLARCALLGVTATACALLAFSPQLIAWKYWYGSFVTVPQGEWFMQWSRFTVENLLNILFWSKNGLASWHPIYWLAGFGLAVALRRERWVALPLLLALAAELYVAAVCRDLWAGWSFGHRRLLGTGIFFAFGLGHLLDLLARPAQRRHWSLALLLLAAVVAPFAALNVDMMQRLFAGRLRVAIAQEMRQVYGLEEFGWASSIWKRIGNPLAAPAVAYDRLVFGLPAKRYDTVAGDYLLYRFAPEHRPHGVRLGFEHDGVRKHLIAGELTAVDGQRCLLASRRGNELEIRLALPFWLLESDLWLTVHGRILDPLREPTAEQCALPISFEFNGRRYPFAAQGCRFAVPVRIPRDAVRWGLNDLRLGLRESEGGSANLALQEIFMLSSN
ncbi:MAG: hypothetical protein JXR83_07535, partial [Deltaproteobacteria bacterium]|nr:hypothetical protein [Deltaproteobacteria bacterium]